MSRDDLAYPRIGATRDPEIVADPPPGFRALERRALIGTGPEHWDFARAEVLRWGVSTRSGFRVATDAARDGRVQVGDRAELTSRMPGRPGGELRQPVEVVWVVDEQHLAGFAYGTLPGHPLLGEEAFLVDRDADGIIHLTVRSFSTPTARWRALAPALALVRRRVTGRYLRALADPVGSEAR